MNGMESLSEPGNSSEPKIWTETLVRDYRLQAPPFLNISDTHSDGNSRTKHVFNFLSYLYPVE